MNNHWPRVIVADTSSFATHTLLRSNVMRKTIGMKNIVGIGKGGLYEVCAYYYLYTRKLRLNSTDDVQVESDNHEMLASCIIASCKQNTYAVPPNSWNCACMNAFKPAM